MNGWILRRRAPRKRPYEENQSSASKMIRVMSQTSRRRLTWRYVAHRQDRHEGGELKPVTAAVSCVCCVNLVVIVYFGVLHVYPWYTHRFMPACSTEWKGLLGFSELELGGAPQLPLLLDGITNACTRAELGASASACVPYHTLG